MVNNEIKTMSPAATERMIELDAYRGTEPDVWLIAKQKGNPYIFKVTITNFSARKNTGKLESVSYLFSLYNTVDKSLLWEAESTRLAGFFGGMPDAEKNISVVDKQLKESNIID